MSNVNPMDLHDAILLRVVMNWHDDAQTELSFRLARRTLTLKALGVTNLVCPHENPWGPSVSVNGLRGPLEVREGVRRIEIEMQSGDTIQIEAGSFEWETVDDRSGGDDRARVDPAPEAR